MNQILENQNTNKIIVETTRVDASSEETKDEIEIKTMQSKTAENGLEKSKIKSLVKETLYNSASQALIKIIETPYFSLKIFLTICLITSSGLCSYLVIELILSYLSFGVSTTTRTLYETPALFPKLTICNINPFTTKYAMEFLKEINKELNPNIDIFNQTQMNSFNFSYRTQLISNIKLTGRNRMNALNEREKKLLSHSLKDLMQLCFYNGQICSYTNFTWYFDLSYGNCWQIKIGEFSFPGETYGLQIHLYVNVNENLTSFISYDTNGGLGALIRIDNSSYLTSYLPGDGIKIPAGYATDVSLSRSFKSILPMPYSNCIIDNVTNAGFQSELFELVQMSPYRYTQSACFLQCQQRSVYLGIFHLFLQE